MIRAEIPLRAGAKEYTFRMGANAVCRFEREAAMTIGKAAIQMSDPEQVEMRIVRAMIWAGLKDQHKDISLDDAGNIIDEIGLGNIMRKIQLGLAAAFPPPSGDAENPQMAVGGNGRLS